MDKRHKDIMRSLVIKLRHILVGIPTEGDGLLPGNLDRELERIGIAPDGTITPLDALTNLHNGELRIYRIASMQLIPLPLEQYELARREIIERAAYTWINRLLALRAMEVRDLIESSVLRSEEAYGGLSEQMYFLRQDEPERTNGPDSGWWAVVEEACRIQAKALPGLFALNDPTAALRPTPTALLQCIELLSGVKPVLPDVQPADLDAVFADPDAIGWAYQFYQQEAKDAIDAKCKLGGKVASRAEMSAKTQLFTEPYMVQWLLQNSLGRSYHEAYPYSSLPATWEYYIQPEKLDVANPFGLGRLTLLDPCIGSGHFLRAAFDMFVAMYREQQPKLSAKEIADTILSQHLHGVDLDPRAAQLTALTLYLRAWELVRNEQRKLRKPATDIYVPPAMSLAATPSSLTKGALERHLQRAPEDRIFKALLEDVFTGLEHADILGSLLRPREYLENALAKLVKPQNLELEADWASIERLQAIQKRAADDPDQLREDLLETIANSFHIEAGNAEDVSVALFGREAEQGIRLVQVLARQYAVVVTNPPYLGSAYMDNPLKQYIAHHYSSGKRDAYAAFILRCIELCKPNGRVAMVTMQSWMFLRTYAELRAMPKKKLITARKQGTFTGILREISIEALAHLGGNAFEEISGEVVKSVMYTIKKAPPLLNHQITAFRQVNLKDPWKKAESLKTGKYIKKLQFKVAQNTLLQVGYSIISVYHLPPVLLDLLCKGESVSGLGYVSWGVSSSNNDRFLRLWWEVPAHNDRWFPHVKGGGYCKWEGLDFWTVEWRNSGIAIKTFILERYPYLKNNYELKVRDYTANTPGWTFSSMVGKGLAARKLYTYQITNDVSPAIFLPDEQPYVGGFLNSVVYTFILRGITTKVNVSEGYVGSLPIKRGDYPLITALVSLAIVLKKHIISSNIIERPYIQSGNLEKLQTLAAFLLLIEGIINTEVMRTYNLTKQNIEQILDETGTPAGWYSLIANYDSIPALPGNLDLPDLPQDLFDYFASHKRITLSNTEFKRVKANLRTLYEFGPKAKGAEQDEIEEYAGKHEDEEETTSGVHTLIPTETFLEELSVKMELHPISIYWLLEELRSEGVRCKPEEQRLLEDRLSVLVLRLLGHRWSRQLEAGEPVPSWAEQYGIIPLVSGTGYPTLAERIRERLYHEEGALAVQQTNALLQEITGYDLDQWLRRCFFSKHIRQFKQRPIAWHLGSTPTKNASATSKGATKQKRGSASRQPAFECLLYYHTCDKGALARIRTQYVEPLLNAERYTIEQYHTSKEEEAETHNTSPLHNQPDEPPEITFAKEHIRELEDFVLRLQQVEDRGFASPELQQLLALELLDRWCGDGYNLPASHNAWLRHEQEWRVDINDGVRVNIAPLQLAGVLTSPVLKPTDAKKALSDRLHWRADERRWVRDGKLPRCGWMADTVEASDAWLEQHEAPLTDTPQQLELL